ncbi:MAG: GTPase, partial [Candidatus Brocadiales bacterium]
VPVVAVCAVRTGCGKSAVSRSVCKILKDWGKKVVVIRHPMPYGDLVKQKVQRFATYDDMVKHNCTIEEMEEYFPHIDRGTVVYAGVDYEAIVKEAEKEANIIVWDGGNNDMPFLMPDILITLVDPHRAGDELTYYPGETNLLMADVVVVSKEDTAASVNIELVKGHAKRENPDAIIIDAALPVSLDDPDVIKGKRVLAIEDGPTLTHGGMGYGAATIAAEKYGAQLMDPRQSAVGSIAETFKKFPNIGSLLPAMGYNPQQIKDLEGTINSTDCDAVIIGTPVDLRKIVKINKPSVRAVYDIEEIGRPNLTDVLERFRM